MHDADLMEIISETTYSGTSEAPRKDFVPLSSKNDYSAQYQSGGAVWPPIDKPVVGQGSLPWPLQLAPIDLGDSYVYLFAALNKIKTAVLENRAMTTDQIDCLKKLYTHGKKALKIIKEVGLVFETVANMGVNVKEPKQHGPKIVPPGSLF